MTLETQLKNEARNLPQRLHGQPNIIPECPELLEGTATKGCYVWRSIIAYRSGMCINTYTHEYTHTYTCIYVYIYIYIIQLGEAFDNSRGRDVDNDGSDRPCSLLGALWRRLRAEGILTVGTRPVAGPKFCRYTPKVLSMIASIHRRDYRPQFWVPGHKHA